VPDEYDGLVRIRIELAEGQHPNLKSEGLWAEPLGNDLYRLDNVPFYAYDLHYCDVVRAVARAPGSQPTIVEVVRPSGHKTVRISLSPDLAEDDRRRLLDGLSEAGAAYEHASGRLYSVDVPPGADYPSICDWLWQLEQGGCLVYETGTT
jgi:hypothetical protein